MILGLFSKISQIQNPYKKGEIVPFHAMKLRRISRCLAAPNLIVNTTWRWRES